jgi:chloride channel 3/4/5
MVTSHGYYGFPVVDNGMLIGYVTREQLRNAIGRIHSSLRVYPSSAHFTGPLLEETQNDGTSGRCTLVHHPEGFAGVDLSDIVDTSPMQMRKEMPLELVTSTFQKMVSPR